MSEQVWPWQRHLDPFERARVRVLDAEIAALDDKRTKVVKLLGLVRRRIERIDKRRKSLADDRAAMVARGRHRARNAIRSEDRHA